jgi:signal transduction histidine kinase
MPTMPKRAALEKQREFVADVSHELRTPLTTLRGNLSLLSHQPAVTQEERADIQKDMVDETERMIRLVSALLEQARADSAGAQSGMWWNSPPCWKKQSVRRSDGRKAADKPGRARGAAPAHLARWPETGA